MTPDKKPFFAGTYLPPGSRAGMTGLYTVLQNIVRLWQERKEDLVAAAEHLTAGLVAARSPFPAGTVDRSPFYQAYEELAASFDPGNGGFGRAPKFPTPVVLLYLLRFWKRTGSARALRMAEETLEALRCGGIHDHIGGGFHRYSTDARWFIPHFEKMLYDQALLLMAFSEAWLATKKPVYRQTAEAIITYVTRDLLSPEGAFISAEDADSAGGEGAFYLWTRKEQEMALGAQDGMYAAALFGVEPEGNFPSAETGPGKNILFLRNEDTGPQQDKARVESILNRLMAEREKRPHPRKDGKILTDGNGLMIAALAQSSRAFDNPAYYRMAEAAMHFILHRLRQANGSLLHRYFDNEAAIVAFSDDYAFIIRALIELYETSFDPAWLDEALSLDRYLDRHFSDSLSGGFFTTSDEGEVLIVRKKEIYDGAIPSGNGVMLGNLVLLGHLTGNPLFEERASRSAEGFAGIIRRLPSASCAYLCGLDHLLGPASDIVIAGKESDPVTGQMLQSIRARYLPSVTVHFRRPLEGDPALDALAPFTRAMTAQNGKTTAYVCSGRTCSVPVRTVDALRELLT
jgi:uncharacterized protein YyaL (SSP411 family)